MSEFKVGDKVIRLGTFTDRWGSLEVIDGEEYIVSGVDEGSITLTGYGSFTFTKSNFKLKEETMKIEVGSKLVLKEGGDLNLVYGGRQKRQLTAELEGVGYLEVKRLYPQGCCGVFLKGSWFEADTYHLGVEELKQFKLLEEGKEMVKVNLDTGLTREIFEEEYAVGTLVKVKDLKAEGNGHEHGLANKILAVAEEMLEFSNREFTIEGIDELDGTFKLSGAGYWWFSPSMVEIIKSEQGKEMEQQNEFGLVAGDKVKCVGSYVPCYEEGVVYFVGTDIDGDFGVLDRDRDVMLSGRISSEAGSGCGFSFDNFEKVTEQLEEEKVEVQEQLTPESKITIEGKRYKLVRDLPEISEVEVGDFIKILSDKEYADYGDNGYSLEAGDILKVEDIDEECDRATLKCTKLLGEGSFNSGYIYNRALEDNFEIVEVEVTVKEK